MRSGRARRTVSRMAGPIAAAVSAVLASAAAIGAQTPAIRAYLEPPEVEAGQSFNVVIELSDVQDAGSVRVPADLGVAAGSAAPTMIWVDPGRSASLSIRYTVQNAPAPGSRVIGPLQVMADGHTLATEPLTLMVRPTLGVSVRTRVEPAQVTVGDAFELIYRVLGDGRMIELPRLPDVFDFAESRGGGGGSDDHYSFRMRATAVGEFEIPPVQVRLADGAYETEPTRLIVTDGPVNVTVASSIHSGTIWVGGEFVVRVVVEGVDSLDAEVALPEIEGFAELVEPNADRALRPVLSPVGEPSVERNFRLRATAAGRHRIGPVRIVADGREFLTEPIEIVVDEEPGTTAPPPADLRFVAFPEPSSGMASSMVAPAPTISVWVNEPVVLSYVVLHRIVWTPDLTVGTVSWPDLEEFADVELARRGSRLGPGLSFDGQSYRGLLVRRVALLPLEPGRTSIGSATVEAQLRETRWFRGRPDANQPRSIILRTDPVALSVLPLPEAGRPDSFRGHVGTLELSAWVDRTSMVVGDTLTLEVKVDVEGYLRGLPAPEIEFPEMFEELPPRTMNATPGPGEWLSGRRTFIYRLVAVTAGAGQIPAAEMSYFDPDTGSYGVTRGRPFAVAVHPAGDEL